MTDDLKKRVIDALRTVDDPDLRKDLVTLNMVKDVVVTGSDVEATIELTTPACPLKQKIEDDCRNAIRKVEGIGEIKIVMTARVSQGAIPDGKQGIPGIKNIIAVGSGKGGVGKSTTAVNIAVALKEMGARVGVLDADIYGPNVPGMLGITGRPRVVENRILPIEADGLRVMSMGFLVSDQQAIIWRGPMLHGAMKQMLFDVAWGDIDYLVIDLPPGTGDVQLSLAQIVPITGAVVVTTPQNVALQDVRKGIAMFDQLEVPLFGIVENMSYYLCPKCGHRDEIFDYGGGNVTSVEFGVPFLGEVPLNGELRQRMDEGRPVAADPESSFSNIYRNIAQKIAQQIAVRNAQAGPKPFAVIRGS